MTILIEVGRGDRFLRSLLGLVVAGMICKPEELLESKP
jgi:hypothetical protein